MEGLTDGAHVRLRRLSLDGPHKYLHALEDGVGVSLRQDRANLRSVWAVHTVARGGESFVLFLSAAYGRYLALRTINTPHEHSRRRCRPKLVLYKNVAQNKLLWKMIPKEDESGEFHLHNARYHIWRDSGGNEGTRAWRVEPVPPRIVPPALPLPEAPPPEATPLQGRGRIYAPPTDVLQRTILFAVADAVGNVDYHNWISIVTPDNSVFKLRNVIASQLQVGSEEIVLCVWGGRLGRSAPLIVDLPSTDVKIVVLTAGSPAAAGLRYPNVDAPGPAHVHPQS